MDSAGRAGGAPERVRAGPVRGPADRVRGHQRHRHGRRPPMRRSGWWSRSSSPAYDRIVSRPHARGIRVYGATLTPFGGNEAYDDPAGRRESARRRSTSGTGPRARSTRCSTSTWPPVTEPPTAPARHSRRGRPCAPQPRRLPGDRRVDPAQPVRRPQVALRWTWPRASTSKSLVVGLAAQAGERIRTVRHRRGRVDVGPQ